MLEQALTVAAAKAKLAGLVVAAAAIGGTAVAAGSTAFVPTAGEEAVTTAPTESPSPATVEPTPEVSTAATASPAPEATRTPLPCPSDVANHGAYVSQVAKDRSVTGREHGAAVSEAAKSDCGKPAGEDADSEKPEAPEVEATEAPESEDGAPKVKKQHGNGNGRSHR